MTTPSLSFGGVCLILILGCGSGAPATDQPMLTTRAERTRYEQTTGYGEVVQFMERAAALSDQVHFTTFGDTIEGRPLPLVVVGDTRDARPESVSALDRTRVWLQATIHGGEVCGKEALLMLLRDLVAGEHDDWLSSLTLLIAPVYNADGNERMAPDNRPFQLGPIGGMGERTNAQGLDLNRDHLKLESPEARALSRAYQQYDHDTGASVRCRCLPQLFRTASCRLRLKLFGKSHRNRNEVHKPLRQRVEPGLCLGRQGYALLVK